MLDQNAVPSSSAELGCGPTSQANDETGGGPMDV